MRKDLLYFVTVFHKNTGQCCAPVPPERLNKNVLNERSRRFFTNSKVTSSSPTRDTMVYLLKALETFTASSLQRLFLKYVTMTLQSPRNIVGRPHEGWCATSIEEGFI